MIKHKNSINSLLSYFYPQVIERVRSDVNKLITVEVSRNKYRLTVNNYWQSGIYIERLLRLAFRQLKDTKIMIKQVLLLGVGGGSAVKIINEYCSPYLITGVELDSVMIDLGKKYFNLEKEKNFKPVIKDAAKYVRDYKGPLFDLVIMDIFIGCDLPSSCLNMKFVKNIERIMKNKGIFICNLSYLDRYKTETDKFIQLTEKVFLQIKLAKSLPNLLLLAMK